MTAALVIALASGGLGAWAHSGFRLPRLGGDGS
jgi:hypothetical protein